MQPSLVIMAAGLGSRFGSLKQMAPVGPNGETILHYSIYDAHRAGFKKVTFVIQSFFAEDFKKKILSCAEQWMDEVVCVYQDQTYPQLGIDLPLERTKPIGTAHAVFAANDVVNEPFAVINADDFYGRDAFSCLYEFLSTPRDKNEFAMIGYKLENTLSENGSVSRGICTTNENGHLTQVVEYQNIFEEAGIIYGDGPNHSREILPENSIVSLNTWGFSPYIFEEIEKNVTLFTQSSIDVQMTEECFLPSVVDQMIQANEVSVSVLPCHGQWYGVTYQEDLEFVQNAVAKMIQEGMYPENLFY